MYVISEARKNPVHELCSDDLSPNSQFNHSHTLFIEVALCQPISYDILTYDKYQYEAYRGLQLNYFDG